MILYSPRSDQYYDYQEAAYRSDGGYGVETKPKFLRMLEDVADHLNIPYKARAKIGKIADTIKANAQVGFSSIPPSA